MDNNHTLSIITINFNNCVGLERTIKSVVEQKKDENFEYIIIDGGSTDNSLDVIKEYQQYIDYWVSEPDKGIYNAMNKGTIMAHGDYCLYLNSGDWLLPCTQQNRGLVSTLKSMPQPVDLFTYINLQKVQSWVYKENNISFYYVWRYSLWHNNTFIRREFILNRGGYSEAYRIVSDWEFFLKALFLWNASISLFSFQIADNEPAGISASQMQLHILERKAVTDQYFSRYMIDCMELQQYKSSRWIKKYDFLLALLKKKK